MTTANPKGNVTIIASQNLSAQQYRAVTNAGAVAGAGGKPLGILQNKPQSGQAATVCTEHLSKAVAGATIAKDADVMSDATGAMVTAATVGSYIVGRAMESAVAGDIFQIMVLTVTGARVTA
jgi:hypothetical protein